MKTIASTKRTVARKYSALLLSAITLTSVMLFFASCTGDGNMDTNDTGSGTVAQSDNGTAKPLDPNAGTVRPDGDSGNPPAGTDGGTNGSRFGGDFMH